MKILLKLALLALLIYWTPKFVHTKTDGFTLSKIHSHLSPDPRFEVQGLPPTEALLSMLNGPYTYLGAGGQCYAFVSHDGKTVLKLFKHHLRRVHPVLAALPLPKKYAQKRELHRAARKKKLLRDFTSYKLAFEQMPQDSGLLYVQLQRPQKTPLPITLIDKIGIAHTLDLSKVEFALQKRATLAYDYLESCMARGDREKAERGLAKICALIAGRCAKGIYDEDAKIHRNFGFTQDRAILIDVGRLKKDERRKDPEYLFRDMQKITDKMQNWLIDRYPQLIEPLNATIKNYDPENLS